VEQRRDIGQEYRDEVRAPLLDGPADRRTGEERHRQEPAFVLRLGKWRRSRRVQVIDGDVPKLAPAGERVEERIRCGGRPMDEDPHPARDPRHRLIRTDGA
jgi:hypothetical protein